MKINFSTFILFFFIAVGVFAQAPQGFNFQGVARSANADIVASKTIKVRISIIENSAIGTETFAEIHSPTTNAQGLFSLTIGAGTPSLGSFATINWAVGAKFLKTEIDVTGGNNFVLVSTTQMMSVPYALYAEKSGKTQVNILTNAEVEQKYDVYTVNIDPYTGIEQGQTYKSFFELKTNWIANIQSVSYKVSENNTLELLQTGGISTIKSNNNTASTGIEVLFDTKFSGTSKRLDILITLEDGTIYKYVFALSKPSALYFIDNDQDGFGSPEINFYTSQLNFILSYSNAFGYGGINFVSQGGDCRDAGEIALPYGLPNLEGKDINPGAPEAANGVDDNCNGQVDEGFPVYTWYKDVDGDGWGSVDDYNGDGITTSINLIDRGFVKQFGDCNDFDPSINPSAVEAANGLDDNCNGQIDEGLPLFTWYYDEDGDGWGGGNGIESTQNLSNDDPRYILQGGDCDDNETDDRANINPGAAEIANGVDDNCNGQIDEGLPIYTWYFDEDGDGWGGGNGIITTQNLSVLDPRYILQGGDCADADQVNPITGNVVEGQRINPGAIEVYNLADDNCDGQIDEGFGTWYRDLDGDGWGTDFDVDGDGVAGFTNNGVDLSAMGYVNKTGDCADENPNVNPNATEVPNNGIDDNCDGVVD